VDPLPESTSTASGTQHDFNPTDFSTASVFRWQGTTSVTITGFRPPSAGEPAVKYCYNGGDGSDTITLVQEDAGSTATWRIAALPVGGVGDVFQQGDGWIMVYSPGLQRWIVVAGIGQA
jgi:hypothetical protein